MKKSSVASPTAGGCSHRSILAFFFGVRKWVQLATQAAYSPAKRRAKVAWPAVNLAEKWRRWNQWNGDGAGQSAALFVRCCRSHSRRLDLLKWDIAVGTDINVLPLSRPLPLATISSSWNPRYRGIQSNYKTRIKFFSRLPRYLLHNSKLVVKTMSVNPS